MENFVTILGWIGYAFAIIGFFGTAFKTIQVWTSLQAFSWQDFDKYAKKIIKTLQNDNYYPDVIVTVGRGGAIVGSVISGNLHRNSDYNQKDINTPILGCDRMYKWEDGQRIETTNRMLDFMPLAGKNVLIVAGDVLTGGTMKCFIDEIRKAGVEKVKTACLVKGITSAIEPDYVGKEIPGDFRMPWMYKNFGYVRDSRKAQITKGKKMGNNF